MIKRHRMSHRDPASGARTRLCAAISGILATATPLLASPSAAAGTDIDEIIVTATRRDEAVSDIPYNISAIGAADIQDAGITDLQSLTQMIPGLVSPDLGARASSMNSALTIRGLNASSVNTQDQNIAAPVVSTYVDETPLFANLKMTDIARVEVLRGPQGTLYGSGSLGGTVRLIHNEPDTTKTEFEVSTGTAHTANSPNLSGSLDAIANLPISDTVAFRASFGFEKLGGFTDAQSVAVLTSGAQPVLANPSDPLTSGLVFASKHGVDWSTTWYARGALLWKLNDALKIELVYQHQTDQSGGFSETNPAYRYTQTLYVDQPGAFATDLGSLDITLDAGFATISSNSSLTSQTSQSQYDLTGLIESLALTTATIRELSRRSTSSHRQGVHRGSAPRVQGFGSLGLGRGRLLQLAPQTLNQVEPILGFGSWSQLPGSASRPGARP